VYTPICFCVTRLTKMSNPFEIEELLKSRLYKQVVGNVLKKPEYVTLDEQRKNSQSFGWLDDAVPDNYIYPEDDSSDMDTEVL